MPKKLLLFAALLLCVALTGFVWLLPAPIHIPSVNLDSRGLQSGLERAPLIITRADGRTFKYYVEIAATVTDQAHGLMDRTNMPAQDGMIFPYNPAREVAFWMKDTFIPLDMLFIYPDGTIGRIVTAEPNDITPIPSLEPVAAVIELNGGETHKQSIMIGDKVNIEDFRPIGKTLPM